MTFGYFGTKKALVKYYPPPAYSTIIEPFAGAAAYSVKYGLNRDVWLNDIYPVIYEIWKWIRSATKSDIYNLPKLVRPGESLADYTQLSKVEKDLLGFATGVGRAQPSNKITAFAAHRQGTIDLRAGLLRLCGNITHWKITCLDYSKMPNQRACWYVDPPYQFYGKHYKHNEKSIDFKHLGGWCKERRGQVIVCEGHGADWLPFKPLREGIKRLQRKDKYSEVFYYQSDKPMGLGIY